MVLSIQAKRDRSIANKWEAYFDNGRAHSGLDVVEWAIRGEELGAGEILLTSVDNEGLQRGMDLELIRRVTEAVSIPVICCGGVGGSDDIVKGANCGADVIACASILHYKKKTVQELKREIIEGGKQMKKVVIINYGLSNLLSVEHAFSCFGVNAVIESDAEQVLEADVLVLPGVGAFEDGMRELNNLGIAEMLRKKVAE